MEKNELLLKINDTNNIFIENKHNNLMYVLLITKLRVTNAKVIKRISPLLAVFAPATKSVSF